MSINPLYLQHAQPENLAQQAEEQHVLRYATFLRVVEIMFLELREFLDAHPEVATISYDQEGDVDCMPYVSCLDANGSEIGEGEEDREALAEAWNDRIGPPVEAFLSTQEGRKFRRAHFVEDVVAGIRQMQKQDLLFDGEECEQWLASFQSHLSAIALDQSAPSATATQPRPRM